MFEVQLQALTMSRPMSLLVLSQTSGNHMVWAHPFPSLLLFLLQVSSHQLPITKDRMSGIQMAAKDAERSETQE
jgi:hypothetical protein